jgi:hypothetical protein
VVTVGVVFTASSPGQFTDSLGINTQLGEYHIGIGASATAPAATTAAVGLPVIAREPIPNLTKLKVRASASRLRGHRRKRLVASYNLSAPATVSAVVYRRAISHRCHRGVKKCVHWVRTRVRLRVQGHRGKNLLTVRLGTLAPADYRLTATPINREGARGATRHVEFKTFH